MSKCIKCGRELTSGEIPMFNNNMCYECYKDYQCEQYPFKKGIYDMQDKIEWLKQQLAEKDKEIEHLIKRIDKYENIFRSRINRTGDMQKDIELYINQLAIQELEKVKKLLLDEYKKYPIVYDKTNDIVAGALDRDKVNETIDQQINALKGENDAED